LDLDGALRQRRGVARRLGRLALERQADLQRAVRAADGQFIAHGRVGGLDHELAGAPRQREPPLRAAQARREPVRDLLQEQVDVAVVPERARRSEGAERAQLQSGRQRTHG
jgi:hypothetical protein